jgi:hypothetical protein
MRKRPSIAWTTAIQARPTHPQALLEEIPSDQVPDLRIEAPTFPLHLLAARNVPPRPRAAGNGSGGTGTGAEKAETPLIAPQLTAAETNAALKQTNQNLSIAEKKLESTRGKQLNATQADLVSKILGFIKDAREAAQNEDWARARSLSQKAQVLSEELND